MKKEVLVGDIGGTNTTFAIFNNKFKLIHKHRFDTKKIKNFKEIINKILIKHNIKEACFAIAGLISKDRKYAKLSNVNLSIDVNNLKRSTKLKKIYLINDFEAIGYSIDILKKNQVFKLNNKKYNKKGIIAVIGAGTGFGMSILVYDKIKKMHYPLASEGGHSSFLIKDKLDYEFYEYLKNKLKKTPDLEEQLSGRGILNIYNFLKHKGLKHDLKISKEIESFNDYDKPSLITRYTGKDYLCGKVIELFVSYYARASNNLSLTTRSSRVYVAGGIAPKILTYMKKYFMKEFVKHQSKSHSKILKETPVFIILDYDISLYGAANYILEY